MNPIETKREYDRKRYLDKKEFLLKQHAEWKRDNKGKISQQSKKYMKKNRIRENKRISDWRKDHPKVQNAYNKSRGIIIQKGTICETRDCNELALEKHHPDYDHPKSVEFLCKNCHLNKHGGGLKLIQ